MSPGRQGMLSGAFIADPELKNHYRDWLPSYRVWATNLCNFKQPLPGGEVIEFDEYETAVRLADMIEKGDKALAELMQLPGTRRRIAVPHIKICELFAMNVVAREPVSAT